MRLKVCGATRVHEVDQVAAAGADLVGLWHGVPAGHANVGLGRLTTLGRAAVAAGIDPVLVTVKPDPHAIQHAVRHCGVRWIQLHGYQLPSAVRALRAVVPTDVTIVKALHVHPGGCLEQRLIRAYDSAGVDVYLLDAIGDGGRIGSTGRTLAVSDVLRIVELTDRPFLLAGGLTATNAPTFAEVAAHPAFLGIDVDSGARDATGHLTAEMVADIKHAWTRQVLR